MSSRSPKVQTVPFAFMHEDQAKGLVCTLLRELLDRNAVSEQFELYYPSRYSTDKVAYIERTIPNTRFKPHFSAKVAVLGLMGCLGQTVTVPLQRHSFNNRYRRTGLAFMFWNAGRDNEQISLVPNALEAFLQHVFDESINADELRNLSWSGDSTARIVPGTHIASISLPGPKEVVAVLKGVRTKVLALFQQQLAGVAVGTSIAKLIAPLLAFFKQEGTPLKQQEYAEQVLSTERLRYFTDPDELFAATLIALNALIVYVSLKCAVDEPADYLIGLAKELLVLEQFDHAHRWNSLLARLSVDALDLVRKIEPEIGTLKVRSTDEPKERRPGVSPEVSEDPNEVETDWGRLRIYLSFTGYERLHVRGLGKDDPVVTAIIRRADGKYVLVVDSEQIGYSALRILTDNLQASLDRIKRGGRRGAMSDPGFIQGRLIHQGNYKPRLREWLEEVLDVSFACV